MKEYSILLSGDTDMHSFKDAVGNSAEFIRLTFVENGKGTLDMNYVFKIYSEEDEFILLSLKFKIIRHEEI